MKISKKDLKDLIPKLKERKTNEVLKWAADIYKGKIVLTTSLGPEDQVILDIIQNHSLPIHAFTIDTGRLFNETYELIEKTETHYGIKIRTYFPDTSEIEETINSSGINMFYKSIEQRKQCCKIRKVNPLNRALKEVECWITGLRKDQSKSREKQNILSWDQTREILKINPLINWTEQQVWDYIKKNNVPYNTLHKKGYPSIGCACCTKEVIQGEHFRTGRWWWEANEHKECGIHILDGKLVRTGSK